MNFILTTSEAELLMYFELNPSLEMLSKIVHKDQTVVSRQLKRISEKGDFLIKSSGRWKITEIGKRLNLATTDYLLCQNQIINNEIHLKIGSTREFCSRILGPNIKKIEKTLGVKSLSIISFEGSVENALLSGQVDLAFDCGKPYSPDIKFKQVLEEPIVPVVSSKIYKDYSQISHFKELEHFPHILCNRLQPEAVSKKPFTSMNIISHSNDIAVARSLCISAQGWALLPLYTVKEELKSKELKMINDISFASEKFGVWCLRDRKSISSFFNFSVDWLNQNENLMKID